ncbi:MAG: hypothetical protein CMM25_03875 [Rhodospirillaceae bacterium]|nr:hypothetical protein [Rhodospirillaceae bacterium]
MIYCHVSLNCLKVCIVLCVFLSMSACSRNDADNYRTSPDYRSAPNEDSPRLGINLFKGVATDGTQGAVAVNAFLWRASLDTIAFMPLASADPFGGVIITDWYSPPQTPKERFKVNVYVLGRALRADGVKVSVFRQTTETETSDAWTDMSIGAEVQSEFEEAILTRARQLRMEAVSEEE